MLENLKRDVWQANLDLVKYGLVSFTWGNVSGLEPDMGLVVIKPSGVAYGTMQPQDMVVVSLESGEVVEGSYRPSTDTPTHLELYRSLKGIRGVAHTHSLYSTAFAQAGVEIPVLGTTHADYFYGSVSCTRPLLSTEIEGDYEVETGKVIAATMKGIDPLHMPAVLVAEHGPFIWGKSAGDAAVNAAYLEEVARLAWMTLSLEPNRSEISEALLCKHFLRKHGTFAYYGQK